VPPTDATDAVVREWFGGDEWTAWTRATGDWGGARTALEEAGVSFNGSFVGDWGRVFSGGVREGSDFRFLLDLNLSFDLGVIAGLEGGSVFADFQTANETVASGDSGAFQAISNIAIGGSITQLSQLWYEQWLGDELVRIKLGKIDANTEFAFIGAAGGFINASAGFSPAIFALPTYPNPSTALVAFVYPDESLYLGAGLFDGAAAVDGVATGSRGPATMFSDDLSDDLFWIAEAGVTLREAGPLSSLARRTRICRSRCGIEAPSRSMGSNLGSAAAMANVQLQQLATDAPLDRANRSCNDEFCFRCNNIPAYCMMAPTWLMLALSPSALALQLGLVGSGLRAAAPALARVSCSIRMDASPPDDWDAAWKNFSRGADAESSPAAEVKEPADSFWLAPPSRPSASEGDEGGGTFRLRAGVPHVLEFDSLAACSSLTDALQRSSQQVEYQVYYGWRNRRES